MDNDRLHALVRDIASVLGNSRVRVAGVEAAYSVGSLLTIEVDEPDGLVVIEATFRVAGA